MRKTQHHHPLILHPFAVRLAAVLLVIVLAACQVSPPISVGKRESLAGQGIVLSVTNTSAEHLHDIEVVITSPAGESRTYNTSTLKPHETISVGWMRLDGWKIPEGSKVSVRCKGYALSSGPWKV